jgi:hypothetical protein
VTIQALAAITRYPVSHLIQAHQLYQQALANPDSIIEAGLDGSLESFRAADDNIVRYLTYGGQADLLDQDLRHEPYDDSALSDLGRFYARFCIERDLYLNLHLVDRAPQASVGDEIVPPLVTSSADGDPEQRVADIMSGSTRSSSPSSRPAWHWCNPSTLATTSRPLASRPRW